MAKAGYEIGKIIGEMNAHKFHATNAKVLGIIGRILGYGSIILGTLGAFYAWLVDDEWITLWCIILAAVGITMNVVLHKIAIKIDQKIDSL